MGKQFHVLLLFIFLGSLGYAQSQVNSLEADPLKEKKFCPYMIYNHGGKEGLEELKKYAPYEYLKELWYYSESFYVKRNYFEKGLTLDESTIDVGRFEKLRKENEEAIITIIDYKDAIVLLPLNKLLFKPIVK